MVFEDGSHHFILVRSSFGHLCVDILRHGSRRFSRVVRQIAFGRTSPVKPPVTVSTVPFLRVLLLSVNGGGRVRDKTLFRQLRHNR
jgi:hypothetical protein